MESAGPPEVVTVTDRARAELLRLRAAEDRPDELALFVEVTGVSDGRYTAGMYLGLRSDAEPGDVVRGGELPVVVPVASVEALTGATIDLSRNLLAPGWVIDIPATPPRPSSPAVDAAPDVPLLLEGTVEERVGALLAHRINPAIASHGGHAELVGVEGDTAMLRLSGGCQGCGMASVTLTQGIEVAIRDAIPEIRRVVDATDHAAGSNPYFEPAKK